ncbi:MAG: DUF4129 domain-containing protein [Gemmataceae bacterium]|nr:DUF4129 domain-containing protein [Gemmataceae bacterium]
MADRPRKTLADYVAIAISPVLIMALVGSLVFFLLEVLYVGQYHGRLQWILFFFVFGAVLIARISMTSEIAGRAGLYGLVLGGLTWVALLIYVEYPPGTRLAEVGWLINLVLIAIIWWSAHRLTWDCTLIDDQTDASGAGLLEAAGLEQRMGGKGGGGGEEEKVHGGRPVGEAQKAPKEGKRRGKAGGLAGWWERYQKYRTEQSKRPHAPGVWVVYFSLATLPLFGLGQILISADADRTTEERNAVSGYSFFLMVIYVASGMGLLATTSFLNLRRYLRQRGVKMPAAVTGVWLLMGAGLIVGLLAVSAFLPRPTAEYRRFLEWTGAVGSPERDASDHATRGDGAGKDRGTVGSDKGKAAKSAGKEAKAVKDARGTSKDGKGADKGGEGRDRGKGADKKDTRAKGQGDKQFKGEKQGEKRDGGQEGAEEPSTPRGPDLRLSPDLVAALKWIVGIVVARVVLFYVLRSGLRWLANFTEWARRLLDALRTFWEGLWGGGSAGSTAEAEAARQPPKPFTLFRDPFLNGAADTMAPAELVQYSFDALEAWTRERKLGRETGETPLEFARRVGAEYPALEDAARRLTNLYAGLAYADQAFPRDGRDTLRRYWRLLADAVERPMSAGVSE